MLMLRNDVPCVDVLIGVVAIDFDLEILSAKLQSLIYHLYVSSSLIVRCQAPEDLWC